jgi:hypothetical protein
MAPFDMGALLGSAAGVVVPLLIGVGFGAVLEMSGFGDSRKLAAQFYLKDLTVLKVMFTAIIVAAVLLGLGSALGWVDMDRVFVNPTFLWPGVLGGFVMGVGFIVGGFCPGTSLVAAATLKIDGVVFVLGVVAGIFAFGETVGLYDAFWHSSSYGRLTLPDVFGVPTGVVIVLVVAMALFMFLLGEVAEARFGRGEPVSALRFLPRRRLAWAFGAVLLAGAGAAAVLGPVDPETRWQEVAAAKGVALAARSVYVHPTEVAELQQDAAVYTRVLDVRSEAHFNLFHLKNAERVTLEQVRDPIFVARLRALPPNTVTFVVSNDEERATAAWRLLVAQNVLNVYVVEGGVNGWLDLYPPPPCLAERRPGPHAPEELAWTYHRAAGDCCNAAFPELAHRELPTDCFLAAHADAEKARSGAGVQPRPAPAVAFTRKVKLQKKAAVKGGCG